MPMLAMTGRSRFGGFNALSSACVSDTPTDDGDVYSRAAGNDSIHAPPIAPAAPTTPIPLHNRRRDVM
jgi:hypothetical protein